MQNDLNNFFGINIVDSIEIIIDCFDKLELSIEQIEKHMQDMPELTREGLHIIALSKGKEELASKIEKACQLIELHRINEFKSSVVNGSYEEFLKNMTYADKVSLLVDMGLSSIRIPSEKSLTEEEQIYYNIINNSIDNDLKREISATK